MKITYSTNMMGPVSNRWYEDNGIPFTEVTEQSVLKPGTTYTRKVFEKQYCGGRIDIYGTGDPYGAAVGAPIMEAESWYALQKFCSTLTTDRILSMKEIEAKLLKDTGFQIKYFEKKD